MRQVQGIQGRQKGYKTGMGQAKGVQDIYEGHETNNR